MPRIHIKSGESVMGAMGRIKRERVAEIVSDAAINAAKMVEAARLDERERCAKVADAVAAKMQEQIDRNNEYMIRTGSIDHEPNDLCGRTKRCAENIAADIRNLKE